MDALPLRRNFSSSDGYMLQTARAIHTLLSTDLPAFSAFDLQFTPAFLGNFQNLINAASDLSSDNLVIDEVATKSENVDRVWDTARIKYGDLRYFVRLAFPQSKSVQNQFGFGIYKHARRSPVRMLRLLQDVHQVALGYQAELLAAGYTLAKIAEIESIRQQLESALSAQSLALKERPKTTAERIIAMNDCHQRMMQICAAAQIVYMTDAARRRQYAFYPRRERKLAPEVMNNSDATA